MNFSLIVPIAQYKDEYEHDIPPVFVADDEGIMPCIRAIMGLDLTPFTATYFTILKRLDERYQLADKITGQLKALGLPDAEIVILEDITSSQPETVYETIKRKDINGAIYIKDADCSFVADTVPNNTVAIFPLEELTWVNPQDKSYVAVDDMFYITNIVEKRIVSHYFSAGGYSFASTDEYIDYYRMFAGQKGFYLSHIIYSMLLDRKIFRPILVKEYKSMEK